MGALRPGERLEGTSYQVVREIGSGGMGVVYEIEHVRLKKRYVAKVIHEQIKNEDSAAKRMEREAQVLATISHPNVVQVHDVGVTSDGTSYFVMEKLEGLDLRQMMRRGLTRTRSIEIICDVLEALDYVHRRGIVHRDIKPENVFLAEQAGATVTKVLDFGIVHIFDQDGLISQHRITKTGGFVGTLYYAAPEQMQGQVAGPPNDVYAAALVLFELLAGKGPFDDDPGVGLSRCFKPAPLLTAFVPTAPRDLAHVISGALEQAPSLRPTAGKLATDLRQIAVTLKAEAHDDVVRAEVDDLLRHIAPADPPPAPRPAAGRRPTAENALAFDATAVPPTPVMAGAPGRVPAPVEATMASASPSPAIPAARPAAGEPPPTVPPGSEAPIATSRMLVADDARNVPREAPQLVDAAQRISAPPQSPRYTATSPGVYATIDNGSVAPVPGSRPSKTVAALAAAVALLGTGGAIAYRTVVGRATSPRASRAADVVATSASTAVTPPSAATASAPTETPAVTTTNVAGAQPSATPAPKVATATPKARATVAPTVAKPASPRASASAGPRLPDMDGNL